MSTYRFYIGCYTKGPEEPGVALVELDSQAGRLELLSAHWCGQSPSFLTRRGDYLYAANEVGDRGFVSACRVDEAAGSLAYLNGVGVAGMHTCHVAAAGDFLYAANYSSGGIFGARILPDGSLGEICAEVQFEGSGPNPDRQEKPHAHSVNLIPTGEKLIVADLGTDRLMLYGINHSTGKLTPDGKQKSVVVRPGEGPRHMAFHPNGRWLYIVTELGNNVIFYRSEAPGGPLKEEGVFPLLQEEFTAADTAADIHLSPDGRRLYASVRGKNLISAFNIRENGGLHWIGSYPSHGDSPRSFCITADGRYILIAHQNSGDLVLCSLNRETGSVSDKLDSLVLPGASCVIET